MKTLKNDRQKNLKVERLKALGATTFVGTTNPDDAKIWMDKLEKCFDVMECREDRKVRLATFLLQEGASDWWKSVTGKRPESEITSWSEFKKAFYEEYYPQSYKDAKRSEFLSLVQGSMTVAEYENKYIELSKYAATIIRNEVDKCRRFEEGLREGIRTSTNETEWREFRKLVETALRVERSILESKSQKEPSKNVGGFSTITINTLISDNTDMVQEVVRHGTPKQKFYGKSSPTTGSSTTKQVGQEQHMVKAKPTMKGSEGSSNLASPSEPKSKQEVGTPCTYGKVFAMIQQKAHKLPK